MRVAGLAPFEGIFGLENIDVTALVPGHMAYRTAMPRLLREVGWAVDSDEFAEIEDPVCCLLTDNQRGPKAKFLRTLKTTKPANES
jgi:hypothetical protein